MRFLPVTLFCMGVLGATPAFALHCYELALKDDKGAVIPMSVPPIGLMIGANPVVTGVFPPHAKREPIAPAQCPEALVESIRTTFNAACPGEDNRKKAAEANGVPMAVIEKGCNEMDAALQNKDVEFYRERDKELFPQKSAPAAKKPSAK